MGDRRIMWTITTPQEMLSGDYRTGRIDYRDADGELRIWAKPHYWTPEEDEKLLKLMGRMGRRGWKAVAKAMGDKTPDQCCQRWHRVLNPHISHAAWSDPEEKRLEEFVLRYGEGCWSKIAEALPGRTGQQCRYRWRHLKRSRESRWVRVSQSQSQSQSQLQSPSLQSHGGRNGESQCGGNGDQTSGSSSAEEKSDVHATESDRHKMSLGWILNQ